MSNGISISHFQSSRRRVSEIALPKVLGGAGAPNLHLSSSMVRYYVYMWVSLYIFKFDHVTIY